MFNNVIYFIIVLLIYNINIPVTKPDDTVTYAVLMFLSTWVLFALYCRWLFQRLLRSRAGQEQREEFGFSRMYQSHVLKLSIIAIILFALDVYLFDLKSWIRSIPGLRYFSVAQGVLGVCFFILYLVTIWYFAHPVYRITFQTDVKRNSFILSNLKLNLPILFPWVVLTLIYDLLGFTPLSRPDSLLNRPLGQVAFFGTFLVVLVIFMPRFIQSWWSCSPLEGSGKVQELREFLKSVGFTYRDILRWPIFEGRMMTAGIMGIVPRYRYILVTDALLEILSVDELKAVLAHEVGHARYRHMLFYVLFFIGFMVLFPGLFDLSYYFFAAQPLFLDLFSRGRSEATNVFYIAVSLPILFSMFIYFRYVMGFFMRNFERQADIHSAALMGDAEYTISSLEKIAYLSGRIRDLPSWHHFSIRERIDYLHRLQRQPVLKKRHNRFLVTSLAVYLSGIVILGYSLNFSPLKQKITDQLVIRGLKQRLTKDPTNIALYRNLAMIYHQTGKYREAIEAYEKALSLDENQPVLLNNLAWLLVTAPDERIRQRERALVLAKKAVRLNRSPVFLDTLAEAYYANGLVEEAIRTIDEAISVATEGIDYYKKQREKFSGKRSG
ncbi:MAG: M48 family metalloprotease [Deltaproteobacteria bacterium]|nr:M48 family metalloprotease [Deltaproteobacteria bacterium]